MASPATRPRGFFGKKVVHLIGVLLTGLLWLAPAQAAEICDSIANSILPYPEVSSSVSCTFGDPINIESGINVTGVGVTLSLYPSSAAFIGPVSVVLADGAALRIDVNRRPLNDTGITSCNDDSTNGLSCPVTNFPGQDAEYGRDVTHNDDSDGHAGFSFTKLDANGSPLPASASTWSCVKDNVTGLTWEVKTDDGGLHDRGDRYNWYNTDASANGGHPGYADDDGNICYGYNSGDPASYCNTQAYVARVNQAGWCGHNDWRMPNMEELRSLVDYSILYPEPAIDTSYFPNDVGSFVWSSSPYAYNSSHAWLLSFANGSFSAFFKGVNYSVRLVRGGQ